MLDRQRFKLHFGPYRASRFEYGAIKTDALLGKVRIIRLSDAHIPWPLTTYGRPILYGGLVRAVRKESLQAVAHWFGVSKWLVGKWRRKLAVNGETVGTKRLRREYGKEPWFKAAQRKAWSKAADPKRRAKIAAAKTGKTRPASVHAALRKANLGRTLSAEHRRKMSETHKRLGTRPPKAGPAWKPWEDKLCRTLRVKEVAARTGRSLRAVYDRRHDLKLPDGRRRSRKLATA